MKHIYHKQHHRSGTDKRVARRIWPFVFPPRLDPHRGSDIHFRSRHAGAISPFILPLIALLALAVAVYVEGQPKEAKKLLAENMTAMPAPAATVTLPFHYGFDTDETLPEAGEMGESRSPYWWLNSGALMEITGGVGMTNQGDLPQGSEWQKIYLADNAVDTDGGIHPQNIFRLLTRRNFGDVREEVYMNIAKYQLSQSPNRSESNGLLLFARYGDENDLYYAGIRVDGTAVIKKKAGGVYYTMAQAPVFPGTYDRGTTPDLLPHDEWIGLRLDTKTQPDNTLLVSLFTDVGKTGVWKKVLEATDDGVSFGGVALIRPGMGGIRTDFMDVRFDDYRLSVPGAE